MKYTKANIQSHAEFVCNCIASCQTFEQLKIAAGMISILISERFDGILNPIELNMYEDYLFGAIEVQKEVIENRGNIIFEYPTFERYLN